MNTNTKKNAMNARNIRQIEIDKYYDIFLKRYKYQLSLNQTADSPSLDERFENYSKIINTIADEPIVPGRTRQIIYNNNSNINNDFKHNVILDLKNNKGEEDKLKYYAIKIIKKILKIKAKIKTDILQNSPSTFTNMSLISTHGICTTKFFKIPNNLMICILTPLNRLGYYGEEFVNNIIDELKEPHFNNSFLSNPSCYLRDTKKSFLEFATTFYPGQMCNDLKLSIYQNEIGTPGFGYYDIDSSKNLQIDNNIVASSSLLIDQITTLSELITYKNISGVLFVTCCRSCDLDVSLIDETKKIYILEKFTNILNKTIDNPEDGKYNRCNLLLKHKNPIERNYKKARFLKVKYPELANIKKTAIKIKRTLNKRLNTNKALSNINHLTIKKHYNQILINDDSISAIKAILLSNLTDKEKYEKLNKEFFYLNDMDYMDRQLKESELQILINIFNKSLDNNENAINYLWSYIFYNVDLDSNLIAGLLDIYKTNKTINIITTLYLSGDIKTDGDIKTFNISNLFSIFDDISSPYILLKCLNISDNKNLMSFEFSRLLPKTLEKIDAHNCNILFINKSILYLNNLKEINLDENQKLSFARTLFVNIDSNTNYTEDEKKYIQSNNLDNLLSYDDPEFKGHPKYNIFLKYLVDYPDPPDMPNPTNPKKSTV